MFDVLWSARMKIVDAKYGVTISNQLCAEIGANKSCPSSNNYYRFARLNIVIVAIVETKIFNHLLRSYLIDFVYYVSGGFVASFIW